MEVTAVSSLVTTSSNNNTNSDSISNNDISTINLSNNNNNGNKHINDKDNLQLQRSPLTMSTKGLNKCRNTSFVTTGNDIIDSSRSRSFGDPPITESGSNSIGSSNHELDEDNIKDVIDLVNRILNEVDSKMSRSNDQPNPTAHANSGISCQVQHSSSIPTRISLDISVPTKISDSPNNQSQDLSPDEATSDLVIDADTPSNDSQGNSSNTSQSDPELPERDSTQNQTEESSATSEPHQSDISQQNSAPEDESNAKIYGPASNADNKTNQVIEEKQDEAKKPPDQYFDMNLVSGDSQVSDVADDDREDLQEDKAKDIVTLRNLEITPPPPPPEDHNEKKDSDQINTKKKVQGQKRRRSSVSQSTTESVQTSEDGRTKRQRTQTKPYQAGGVEIEVQLTPKIQSSKKTRSTASPFQKSRKKPTASTIPDQNLSKTKHSAVQQSIESQNVIFYEKDDFLAVRNEENTFYLCQLAENVKVDRPLMKIRWLDTKDDGKTYFLTSQYDKVYQKSILMPVIPNMLKSGKKGEQLFSLDDQVKVNIMDRLSKSLSAQTEIAPAQSGEQVTL